MEVESEQVLRQVAPDFKLLGMVPCRGVIVTSRSADPQFDWDRYTLTNDSGRRATVSICVKCRNRKGERGKHGREALVYTFWGLRPSSYQWVKETYRTRFAIETTYRQLGQARIRTCTPNPLLRFCMWPSP